MQSPGHISAHENGNGHSTTATLEKRVANVAQIQDAIHQFIQESGDTGVRIRDIIEARKGIPDAPSPYLGAVPTMRVKIAALVHTISSIPGARKYFEKVYQYEHNILNSWLEQANLSSANSDETELPEEFIASLSTQSPLTVTNKEKAPDNNGKAGDTSLREPSGEERNESFNSATNKDDQNLDKRNEIAQQTIDFLISTACRDCEISEYTFAERKAGNAHPLEDCTENFQRAIMQIVAKIIYTPDLLTHFATVYHFPIDRLKTLSEPKTLHTIAGSIQPVPAPKNTPSPEQSAPPSSPLPRVKVEQKSERAALPYAKILEKIGMVVAGDEKTEKIWQQICKYAANPNLNILIRGESGSGKELFPRAIHEIGFAGKPLIVVNCGAYNPQLIESELFGHEKGAFTDAKSQRIGAFEQARGGVIVLDEMGDMDLQTQVKLLRAIENKKIRRVGGEVDISIEGTKIVATTNKKVQTMVDLGTFRHDLLMRFGVQVVLPALRDRDVPQKKSLVKHFVNQIETQKKTKVVVAKDALLYLMNFPYRGNIREMKDVIEKAYEEAAFRDPSHIQIETIDIESAIESSFSAPEITSMNTSTAIPEGIRKTFHNGALQIQPDPIDTDTLWAKLDFSLLAGNGTEIIATLEKICGLETFKLKHGNQSAAAEAWGITRGKIRAMLTNNRRYNIEPMAKNYLGEQKFVTEDDEQ